MARIACSDSESDLYCIEVPFVLSGFRRECPVTGGIRPMPGPVSWHAIKILLKISPKRRGTIGNKPGRLTLRDTLAKEKNAFFFQFL